MSRIEEKDAAIYTWIRSREEITKLLIECPKGIREIVTLAVGTGMRLDEGRVPPVKRPTRSLRPDAIHSVIPTQEDFQFDLTERVRGAVQATIQVILDEELERLVGAGPYERSDQRVDVRNGRYDRCVVTTAGEVAVRVGRTRAGGAATAPLGRYARRQDEVDDAVTQAYVHGVSTRDMASVTEALLGKRVGKSTVSRVTKRLKDQVDELRRQPITEPIAYLYLDATFVDARWARTVENVSALVASGIGPDGKRDLLGIHIGVSESEASWTEPPCVSVVAAST